MPDALSKTVPIWCCVLNRALFAGQTSHHGLHTPSQVVSPSEHAQIETRLESLLESFLALELDITALRRQISKPLRPFWITPDSGSCETDINLNAYHTVICCTASRRVNGGEISEGGYIQGSGDDTENWAHGLTAPLFWENTKLLMNTTEADIAHVIDSLLKNVPLPARGNAVPIQPTTSLFVVASLSDSRPYGININLIPHIQKQLRWEICGNTMDVKLGQHSVGSRHLRSVLPHIIEFVGTSLRADSHVGRKIVISCETGRNHSVGVALTLLCLFYDERGSLQDLKNDTGIDKAFIKKRLGWIMMTQPDANPSSATLQSVNSVLMQKPS